MCIHLAPDGYLYEFHKQPLLAANIKRNTILKTKDKNKKSKQTKEQKQLQKPKQNPDAYGGCVSNGQKEEV